MLLKLSGFTAQGCRSSGHHNSSYNLLIDMNKACEGRRKSPRLQLDTLQHYVPAIK